MTCSGRCRSGSATDPDDRISTGRIAVGITTRRRKSIRSCRGHKEHCQLSQAVSSSAVHRRRCIPRRRSGAPLRNRLHEPAPTRNCRRSPAPSAVTTRPRPFHRNPHVCPIHGASLPRRFAHRHIQRPYPTEIVPQARQDDRDSIMEANHLPRTPRTPSASGERGRAAEHEFGPASEAELDRSWPGRPPVLGSVEPLLRQRRTILAHGSETDDAPRGTRRTPEDKTHPGRQDAARGTRHSRTSTTILWPGSPVPGGSCPPVPGWHFCRSMGSTGRDLDLSG